MKIKLMREKSTETRASITLWEMENAIRRIFTLIAKTPNFIHFNNNNNNYYYNKTKMKMKMWQNSSRHSVRSREYAKFKEKY